MGVHPYDCRVNGLDVLVGELKGLADFARRTALASRRQELVDQARLPDLPHHTAHLGGVVREVRLTDGYHAELLLVLFRPAGKVVKGSHEELVRPALLFQSLEDRRIMGGDSGLDAEIVNFVDESLDQVELARPPQEVGGPAMMSNADRLELGHDVRALQHAVQDARRSAGSIGLHVPWRSKANPLDPAPCVSNAWELPLHPLVVARLPSVDSRLLAVQQEFHDTLIREPFQHVLAVLLVEVRVAIEGIATDDEPCCPAWAQGDRGKRAGGFLGSRRAAGNHAGCNRGRPFQEVPAAGSATALSRGP